MDNELDACCAVTTDVIEVGMQAIYTLFEPSRRSSRTNADHYASMSKSLSAAKLMNMFDKLSQADANLAPALKMLDGGLISLHFV